MKLLNTLALGALTTVLTAAPSFARIEASTKDLLQTLNANGINVVIDNPEACDGSFHGAYRWSGMKRWMILCPGDEVTASDHDTVRHEAVHAIQHCMNVARGTDFNTPIAKPDKVWEMAKSLLPPSIIGAIGSNYDEDEWLVELEAALLAREMSGEEIAELFVNACVAE